MSPALKYNPEDVLRSAVQALVTAHIDAFLVAKGFRLARGTSASTAKQIIRAWSPKALEFFYVLGTRKDDGLSNFPSKPAIAESIGWTVKRLHDFWTKTLGAAQIRVRDESGGEGPQKIFRRKRERKFSGDGIALCLCMNPLAHASIIRIVTTTGAMVMAVDDNLQGAIEVAESNDALSEVERSEPRRLFQEREEAVVRGPQLSLVANGAKA